MTKRNAILAILCLALLLIGAWFAHRHSFDWRSLREQLRSVSWTHVAIGIACIYATFWLRAIRWAILLGPNKKVSSTSLIAPQFIGFTAVALFGRTADFARPYLIAKRANLPVAGQIAVYTVERIFDLAAAAILISITLYLAPRDLAHHKDFTHAGMFLLFFTFALVLVILAIRLAGDRLAILTSKVLLPISPKFSDLAAARILDFRIGLDTLTNLRECLAALAISLILWLGVAMAYLESVRAMTATPQLATLSFTQTMLLMATSMGGSLLQLPILGWFTQIGLLAKAVNTFFSVPMEAATAYGAVILLINSLSIVPAGLICSRLAGTTLRAAAKQSEPKESDTAS